MVEKDEQTLKKASMTLKSNIVNTQFSSVT